MKEIILSADGGSTTFVVTFRTSASHPAVLPHIAPAATLSLGSEAQRYIGPQKTRSKDRRSTTGLRDNMGQYSLDSGVDLNSNHSCYLV